MKSSWSWILEEMRVCADSGSCSIKDPPGTAPSPEESHQLLGLAGKPRFCTCELPTLPRTLGLPSDGTDSNHRCGFAFFGCGCSFFWPRPRPLLLLSSPVLLVWSCCAFPILRFPCPHLAALLSFSPCGCASAFLLLRLSASALMLLRFSASGFFSHFWSLVCFGIFCAQRFFAFSARLNCYASGCLPLCTFALALLRFWAFPRCL